MRGTTPRPGQKGGAHLRGNQEARQNCGAAQDEALDAGDVEGRGLKDRQESKQDGRAVVEANWEQVSVGLLMGNPSKRLDYWAV